MSQPTPANLLDDTQGHQSVENSNRQTNDGHPLIMNPGRSDVIDSRNHTRVAGNSPIDGANLIDLPSKIANSTRVTGNNLPDQESIEPVNLQQHESAMRSMLSVIDQMRQQHLVERLAQELEQLDASFNQKLDAIQSYVANSVIALHKEISHLSSAVSGAQTDQGRGNFFVGQRPTRTSTRLINPTSIPTWELRNEIPVGSVGTPVDPHDPNLNGNQVRYQTSQQQREQTNRSELDNRPSNCYRSINTGPNHETTGSGTLKIAEPTFTGKTAELPMQFLVNLKQFRDVYGQGYHFKVIINQCMERLARKWWNITRDRITTWEDFERQFCRRFWSEEIEDNVKLRLDYEWYDEKKKMSRMGYAMNAIGLARDLRPAISETEIVNTVRRHFPEDIRATLRTLGIRTITEILDLLSLYDEEGPSNKE